MASSWKTVLDSFVGSAGVWGVILSLNLGLFIAMGLDKRRARRKGRRLREAFFLAGGLLGGAGGILAGMAAFRHKTRKKKFRIGMPILFFLNLIAYGVCLWQVLS